MKMGWIQAGIFGMAAALGYGAWQRWELTRFGVTNYEIATEKVQVPHRMAVLADLHGFSYGKGNRRLLKAVKKQRPELILIAGDMIVSKYPKTYDKALETLKALVEIAPVCYGFGNHESRAASRPAVASAFEAYRQAAEELGVIFLKNRQKEFCLGPDRVRVYGLELDLRYFGRGRVRPLAPGYMEHCLGRPAQGLSLLLAHNPAYSEAYGAWGADVAFCGHNHGGLVRLPGVGGIVTPQLRPFPKYGEGMHRVGKGRVVISRGLGTHTFHIRIFNRAELVCLTLKPPKHLETAKSS